MTRAIVTGGAGFIGSHLVDYLVRRGNLVLVIDNLSSGMMSNLEESYYHRNFLFINCDIGSPKINDIFEDFKPEKVYHLAAIPGVQYSVEKPFESNHSNVSGLVNVLDASRRFGVERFVFSSSSAIYGNTDIIPTHEAVPANPKSPYALQKYIGEEYCKMYSELYNLDTVCLRYFNVMGPRQQGSSPYSSVISLFAKSIKNNSTPCVYGDGEQSRDFCPVENVVSANYLAGKYPGKFSGKAINIGLGQSITINKLLQLMNIKNTKYLEARPGEVRHSMASIECAKNILNYNPSTPFDFALQNTISWYIENGV